MCCVCVCVCVSFAFLVEKGLGGRASKLSEWIKVVCSVVIAVLRLQTNLKCLTISSWLLQSIIQCEMQTVNQIYCIFAFSTCITYKHTYNARTHQWRDDNNDGGDLPAICLSIYSYHWLGFYIERQWASNTIVVRLYLCVSPALMRSNSIPFCRLRARTLPLSAKLNVPFAIGIVYYDTKRLWSAIIVTRSTAFSLA